MRIALLLLVFVSSAWADDAAKEVPVGELRTQLFDLARPSVEKTAGRPVKFQGSLKATKEWAFFLGEIVDEKGKTIRLGDAESGDTVALWKRKNGQWELVEVAAGITDA